jgi:hypothetical protein
VARLGLAGLMMGSAVVLSAVPAMAACVVTDLTCVTQTVSDPVTTVTDTATGAADQVTDTADATAAGVQNQANQAVQPVTHAVEGILPDPPDPTGILPDVLGSTFEQPSATAATQSGRNLTSTGPAGVDPRARDDVAASSFGAGPVIEPVSARISLTRAASQSISPRGFFDRLGSLVIQAAKALAFPLALALIVLLFVAVQNRIDRKDPKLALAPVAPDVLRFE